MQTDPLPQCAFCARPFEPEDAAQTACSVRCTRAYVTREMDAKRKAQSRRERRAYADSLKPRGWDEPRFSPATTDAWHDAHLAPEVKP